MNITVYLSIIVLATVESTSTPSTGSDLTETTGNDSGSSLHVLT